MSIEKESTDTFIPICDVCWGELPEEYGFKEAVAAMKTAGWVRRRDEGGFYDVCPECQEL